MVKSIPFILIILILFSSIGAASAAPIDSIMTYVNDLRDQVKAKFPTLSIPSVGSVTIECESGATCKQSGENWVLDMTAISSAQTFRLELPSGTKSMSADGKSEVTTQGTVVIDVREKAPIQTIPVVSNTQYKYWLRDSWGIIDAYPLTAVERAGLTSTITTNYDISLSTDTFNSPTISKSYDYRQPQTVTIVDNAGNTASISPSHQVSGGIISEAAGVLFVDDGFGHWQAFDKTSFKTYLDKANEELRSAAPWSWGNMQKTWPETLTRMKTLGLQQFADLPLTKSGNNIVATLPVGSIGTKLQAVIPKTMAKSITVLQHWGEPIIDSATLSPDPITKGQGLATLTVKVTNKGTTDTISVSAIVNGASVTAVVNSLTLSQGQQGTFVFSINPSNTASGTNDISVRATAGGSGLYAVRSVTQHVTVPVVDPCKGSWNPLCDDQGAKTQKVAVTAYDLNNAVLTNAPIYKNGQQMGTGHYEANLPYGNYVFSSDNSTNPKLYAPTPMEISLSGGETKVIALYFSSVSEDQRGGADLTWIFWLAVIGLITWMAYTKGWYAHWGFWVAIVILYFLYELLKVMMGIADSVSNWSLWNWF